jgi:3-hydroxybutyryl-CoA dehydrogenase
VGSGQMGAGIAQVAACSGFQVWLQDISDQALDRAQKSIGQSLEKLTQKGVLSTEVKTQALENLKFVKEISALAPCQVVVEAAPENFELKSKIFAELDQRLNSEALLFSNTSSISITKIASCTKRPTQVAGMHFMNPVPLMKLVEGIRGLTTSDQTFYTLKALTEKLGKVFVPADKDMPGFIVNRVLMPMINEAIYAVHEGIASVEAIDQAMKLGTNQPMGPLTLADFIGLDTCLSIMQVLHEGLGDSKYRPCPLLVKYVEAGLLGKKSGRGFYSYS